VPEKLLGGVGGSVRGPLVEPVSRVSVVWAAGRTQIYFGR
jgi:hypothetical protein